MFWSHGSQKSFQDVSFLWGLANHSCPALTAAAAAAVLLRCCSVPGGPQITNAVLESWIRHTQVYTHTHTHTWGGSAESNSAYLCNNGGVGGWRGRGWLSVLGSVCVVQLCLTPLETITTGLRRACLGGQLCWGTQVLEDKRGTKRKKEKLHFSFQQGEASPNTHFLTLIRLRVSYKRLNWLKSKRAHLISGCRKRLRLL